MPKKRNSNLKRLQGSSSSFSINTADIFSAQHVQNQGQPSRQHLVGLSVNERLAESRSVPTPESDRKKRHLAATANQPSVPPHLGLLLGVPESAPPRPKFGARFRDRMRTPGPAAPKSWLGFTSSWEPALRTKSKSKKKKMVKPSPPRRRPETLLRFASMTGDGLQSDSRENLSHMVLKRLAQNWYMLEEEDYPLLTEIPLRLRTRLLSYLGIFGDPIDAAALEALTQGSEDVTQLDLAGLAGHEPLEIKKLARVLGATQRLSTAPPVEHVAESWDAEDFLESALASSLKLSRFSNLTHLSLSHPPLTASWRDLLALSKHVPQLTHLSMAYWPRPTLTPNLATATVSSRHSPDVRAGGSHYYSALEQDLTEPAALLRQLSSNLLRLQWLDIEGCAEWMPALAIWASSANDNSHQQPNPLQAPRHDPGNGSDWLASKPSAITIFTDNWRKLAHIRLSQGWLPSAIGLATLENTVVGADVLDAAAKHIRKTQDPHTPPMYEHEITLDVERRKARIWLETELKLLQAARRINEIRRLGACKTITMDYGWVQRMG